MSMIKPLEENNNSAIFLKLTFLITLVITGILLDRTFVRESNKDIPMVLGSNQEVKDKSNDFLNETLKKTEKLGESVLGEATGYIQDTTEKIASSVSDLIYENSFGKIVNQIDKLPKDQQDRIKQQICK